MDWSLFTPAVVLATASVVIACCSLFVAFFNFRRSNYPLVRILETSGGGGAAHGRGRYQEYKVVVQNLGIPLHNVSMSLGYIPEAGWATAPMKTSDGKGTREGLFAKGAITEFVFATDMMTAHDRDFLLPLTDLKEQRATLTLYADRYRMWDYRLHDRRWWLKRRWNWFAHRVTFATRRSVTTKQGRVVIKHLLNMPTFDSPAFQLLCFLGSLRRLKEYNLREPPPHHNFPNLPVANGPT